MKVKMKLNSDSIDRAIAQVRGYQNSLEEKAERLRRRVAEELEALCREGFNGSQYNDVIHEGTKVPDVSVHVEDKGKTTVVIADGKEAIFAEFGAGVYYNPGGSPNPLTAPGVVAIGTYGKGRGARQIWGYYEDGELKLTHGTPASMPMYHAIQEVSKRLPEIAREVFSEG